jgi:hypothetical protein
MTGYDDNLANKPIGFLGGLLPFLLPQFVCARDARHVVHRLTQPHAHTQRHRLRGPSVTQSHSSILWHLERVHSVRLRFCAMHVYLDTCTLDTRVVCVDDILQSLRWWSPIALPCDRSRHHLRHVEDGSFVRDRVCGYRNWRVVGFSSVWCHHRVEQWLLCRCAGVLGECVGRWRFDHICGARVQEAAEG